MGEEKLLLPWNRLSRKSILLDGLHGITLVHRRQSNDTSNLETEEAASKSDGSQSFCIWNLFFLRKLWDQRPAWLRTSVPHCHGDRHLTDRLANILTSVPFVLIGMQAPRKKVVDKLYAHSIVGVGLASGFYHCSNGDARHLFRWGDYATIATSSLLLSRASRRDDPNLLYAASALLLPFQPLLVSALHVGLMEVTFAQRAQLEPHLRRAHALHAASSVLGCALFVADDIYPDTPFLHAAWHVAAAIGVATCSKLLEQ